MANLGARRAKDPLFKANELLPSLFIVSDSRALPGASSANVAFWLSVCLCSIFDSPRSSYSETFMSKQA